MPLENTPADNALRNAIYQYERTVNGRNLTPAEITRIGEAAKRLILDDIHSLKTVV
ncbi:MAG: hypothetical protein WD533_05570 [Dehalococcoidia bacterium]